MSLIKKALVTKAKVANSKTAKAARLANTFRNSYLNTKAPFESDSGQKLKD